MNLTDLAHSLDGFAYIDGDGEDRHLELLPGLSAEDIAHAEAKLPCPLPDDVRALVMRTAGLRVRQGGSFGSPTDSVGLDELRFLGTDEGPYTAVNSPCVCWPVLAPDGCGNFWTVDLLPDSREWGPIYYICHDPAVCVYQARDLAEFIGQIRELLTDTEGRSPIARVHEQAGFEIYRGRSATLTHAQALAGDGALRAYAEKLGPAYSYVDMRKAEIGHGVNLMPDPIHRHGHERLFAYKTPVSLWHRLFGKRPPATTTRS